MEDLLDELGVTDRDAEDGPEDEGEPDEPEETARLDDVWSGMGLPAEIREEWTLGAEAGGGVGRLFHDVETYKVHDGPTKEAPMLGTLKPIRRGSADENVAIHCRLHGCSKLVRLGDMPSPCAVLEWFRVGKDLPVGSASKSSHMQLWPKKAKAKAKASA